MNQFELVSRLGLMLSGDISVGSLHYAEEELSRADLDQERAVRLHAEVCYLLAKHYRDAGDREKALDYGNKAVKLYEQIDTATLEKAAPILADHLPDLMHEGVVKQRIIDAIISS